MNSKDGYKNFVSIPFHNPFDINSYPITNPPIFDSTMNLPYDMNDGGNRRRRISISNGQIGQIINHEAIFDYDNNEFHTLEGNLALNGYGISTHGNGNGNGNDNRIYNRSGNGNRSENGTRSGNGNGNGVGNGHNQTQNHNQDGTTTSNSGGSNGTMNGSSALNGNGNGNGGVNIHRSNSASLIGSLNSHMPMPGAPPTDPPIGPPSSDLDFQQNYMFPPPIPRNIIPLKQEKADSEVAGVPPPNHQLIYNDEVIYNPNNGPIPGTAAWKKERLLERNRIAASKCRQRKKQAHLKLQDNINKFEKDLQAKNDSINNLLRIIKFYNLNLKNYFEGNNQALRELEKYIDIDDLENLENWAESELSEL